jgi:glutaredoxin
VKSVEQLEEIVKQASRSTEPVLFLNGMFPSGKRTYYAVDLTQE